MTETIEIHPGVHWLGAKHPELRVFDDLFPTEHGTTYNSYLIIGKEKNFDSPLQPSVEHD